jgi:hypothetical protein
MLRACGAISQRQPIVKNTSGATTAKPGKIGIDDFVKVTTSTMSWVAAVRIHLVAWIIEYDVSTLNGNVLPSKAQHWWIHKLLLLIIGITHCNICEILITSH